MPQLRLIPGGMYNSDIRSIRNAVRANGTQFNCNRLDPIKVVHPLVDRTVDLYVNYAHSANLSHDVVDASVYVVAFGNALGISRFTVVPVPGPGWPFIGAAAGLNVVAEDGSYGSLGANSFPEFTEENLQNAVQVMSTFAHAGPLGQAQRSALVKLIVLASEAVRLTDVEDDIASVLRKKKRTPSWANIHSWGARNLP